MLIHSFTRTHALTQIGAECLLCARRYFGAWDTVAKWTEIAPLHVVLSAACWLPGRSVLYLSMDLSFPLARELPVHRLCLIHV